MWSVIVPVRDWPGERIAACAQSFLRLRSTTLDELLIVDFGSERPVERPSSDDRVRVVRAEADMWSSGEAINLGVLHARGSVFAKADADILIAPESGPGLDQAVEAIAAGTIGLALAQAMDLPESVGVTAALAMPSCQLDRIGRLRPRWGQGGLAIFTRSTWDAIGGFNSRFTGWGNEDNDFAERVRHSGRKVRWIDRDAVKIHHVWHSPSLLRTGVVARRIVNQGIAKKDRSVFRPVRILYSVPPRAYRGKGNRHASGTRRPGPLVSVAFASTERAGRTRMLKEAIASYVGQADNDLEIIVADNGSTRSEHAALCAELAKLRLPVRLRTMHLADASIPAARNIITDAAAGRYICVADDDDIALPNRLADHLACFERNPDLHGSHGGWIDFDETTGVIEINEGKRRTLQTLLFGTGKITAHPTCFYRADALRLIRYDEDLALGSDLDLALRMANAGMRVGHTHSFVLLRRFHATNVTVTGLAHQVTNGAFARHRLKAALGPALCSVLAERARTSDKLAYCRNRIDAQRVIEMLPPRAGVWRLHFPLSALNAIVSTGQAKAPGRRGRASPLPGSAMPGPSLDLDAITRVLEIVDGDVESIGCGVDLGFSFVSRPLKGAGKAISAKNRLAELGIEAELMADVDFTERRERGFDWTGLMVPRGARRLLSEPVGDPLTVEKTLASLRPGSTLRGMLSVISDHAPSGPRHYLVTGPLSGPGATGAAASALRRQTSLSFSPVAAGGVACDF